MKKSKSKEAKFFCESCGSEVPGKAKVCPVCGKFFASVRCPKCGRTGASEEFKNGCPTCGYAVTPEELYGDDYDFQDAGGKNKRKNKKNKGMISSGNQYSGYSYNGNDGSLPPWIYIITLLVLIVLIICLYSCL